VGRVGQEDPGRSGQPADDDKIWNGADDNASGASTLLEIARVLGQSNARFPRTLVFIWFSGEEWGLLGSKHYLDNPLFPLKDTFAMVCMDMVGRNADKPITIKGTASADAWKEIVEPAAKAAELDIEIEPKATGSTDYLNFLRKQIPAIDFHSGFHADYHRRTDTADKIDYDRCAKVSRAGIKIAAELATREGKLEFKEPPRK
jgi:Zn-dependent M28 family amino/carboxypeptidase